MLIYSVYSYYKIIFLYKFCRRLKGRKKKKYTRDIYSNSTLMTIEFLSVSLCMNTCHIPLQ